MMKTLRSLRLRLAALGFAVIAAPLLLVLGVAEVTDVEESVTGLGIVVETVDERGPSRATRWTVLVMLPVAAAAAWWWAGRAVAPIVAMRRVAEEIEDGDLGRRLGDARGPTEVAALAESFDAMLDRLERAAAAQRALVEDVSHELRTPLGALRATSEVALTDPGASEHSYRIALTEVRVAALRLQSVIEQLLTDARARATVLDRNPDDLLTVAGEVLDALGSLAATRHVELRLVGDEPSPARIDRRSVARAITNVVDNAIRHSPAGGSVIVSVRTEGEHGVISVADDGPGIAPHERERVFERFWSGQRGSGAGLGLPIARQVAEAHGGTVTLAGGGGADNRSVVTLTFRL